MLPQAFEAIVADGKEKIPVARAEMFVKPGLHAISVNIVQVCT